MVAAQDQDTSDSASTASEILNQLGMFAFMFPEDPEALVLGGAFLFAGGIAGLFESAPAPSGPTNADLEDDIAKVADLVAKIPGEDKAQRLNDLITDGDPTYDLLQTHYANALIDPTRFDLQPNGDKPQLWIDAVGFQPDQYEYVKALSRIKKLPTPDSIDALVVYADTLTKFESMCRQYLNALQKTAIENYDPNVQAWNTKWDHWYAPVGHTNLTDGLTTYLSQGINFMEPLLDALHDDYRSRLANAQKVAAADAVPARKLRMEWQRLTTEKYLDHMVESEVDTLRGTPTSMGVVDFWKQTLALIAPTNYSFDRKDKFDPPRRIPTTWLTKNQTTIAMSAAKGTGGDMLELLEVQSLAGATKKGKGKLSDTERPFVGPIRVVPWFQHDDPRITDQRVLHFVLVNTTPSPLLIDAVFVPKGKLLASPTVAEYPNIAKKERQTSGWTPKLNRASADPKCWIDAAPAQASGASSVGVWQVMGLPSIDEASIVVRLKSVDSLGSPGVFQFGARFSTDPTAPTQVSVLQLDSGHPGWVDSDESAVRFLDMMAADRVENPRDPREVDFFYAPNSVDDSRPADIAVTAGFVWPTP